MSVAVLEVHVNMVFKKLIGPELRAFVRLLREQGLSIREISRKTRVSRASVHRICNTPICNIAKERKAGGRKRSLSYRQERILIRNVKRLREEEGGFSSKRLMKVSGLSLSKLSDRTVRRCLNRNGYHFLQARKKGLLLNSDFKKRVAFAQNIRRRYPRNVFTHKIAFYLDGTSFIYKINPLDQARAPRGRVWRKRSEGLLSGCTAKGSKVGTGGKVVKLMVAISYAEGVIACEPYEEMNGAYFAEFVRRKFQDMFTKANKNGSRLFIQDGDPSQNSKAARDAMAAVNAELLPIPPRSPDLNPIENIFKLAGDNLRANAIRFQIRKETFEAFQARVIATIRSIPIETINKTISSMDRRLSLLLQTGGKKTRF